MTRTMSGHNGFFDFSTAFGDFRLPALDLGAIADAQRKNLEAMTQANQLALDGAQAMAQHQSETLQRALAEASELWHDLLQSSAPEDRLVRQTEAAKQFFDAGMANLHALNELGTKAGIDVFSVVTRRVSESFDDVRLYAKKQAAAE